ncbi:MAG: hypothetical protein EXS35_03800 [Pedosphaera sp.]|nr:hypothetical protein [Pedosphaera sp.]
MDKNNSIWSGVPAIAVTTGDFKVIIADIGKSIRKQAIATGGAGDEKTNVRLSFEESILFIADQLSALGAKNNDVLLGAQVELSLSALDKMGVDELEALGKTVSGLGTAKLAALADYGITAADVTALDGWKTKFGKVKNAPRTAIADRKGQTEAQLALVAKGTKSPTQPAGQTNDEIQEIQPGVLRGLSQRPRHRGSWRHFANSAHATARTAALKVRR